MERQIIGIDFGLVGLLSKIMRGGVEHTHTQCLNVESPVEWDLKITYYGYTAKRVKPRK